MVAFGGILRSVVVCVQELKIKKSINNSRFVDCAVLALLLQEQEIDISEGISKIVKKNHCTIYREV